jgi:hypothetical protein
MTVFKLSEPEALNQITATASDLKISFSAFGGTIKSIVGDIYLDGVFLKSFTGIGQGQDISPVGLSQLDVQAATTYILGKCRARGIPLFFVQKPITQVIQGLYQSGLAFVVGPGPFMNMITRGPRP